MKTGGKYLNSSKNSTQDCNKKVINMVRYKIDDLVFNKYLPEMFKRVGRSSDNIKNIIKTPNWFTSTNWTAKQEKEFKLWLVSQLRKDIKLTKEAAEREADMFCLNFGWSTGEEKQLELSLDAA